MQFGWDGRRVGWEWGGMGIRGRVGVGGVALDRYCGGIGLFSPPLHPPGAQGEKIDCLEEFAM